MLALRRTRLLTLGLMTAGIVIPQAAQAAETTPPTVSWSAPVSGATVSSGLNEAAGNCYVNTTDASGINHGQFSLDGVALNDERYAPYSCNWNPSTATSGAHTLTATSYDKVGNAKSASVSVNVANGNVLWKADGEQTLVNEWAEYSTAPNCAVTSDTVSSDTRATRTTSPVAKGSNAYQFVVTDGDNCYGERAELGQALPSRSNFTDSRLFNQGDDRWISFQVNLGSDFPTRTPNWNVIAQWKGLAVANAVQMCCPMLAFEVRDGHYVLDNMGTSVWNSPPAVNGRWARFTFHIKFSTSASTGFVEILGDPDGAGFRPLMARRSLQTLNQTTMGTAIPSHARIGIYRNAAISGTAHLSYDGYTVATTQAAAEANAF